MSAAQHQLPRNGHDWLIRAGRLLDDGFVENARLALRQADAMAPDESSIYRGLTAGYRAAGLEAEAVASEMAALAYEQHCALMLYNLATSFLMTQRPVAAERWYRACLRLDPNLVGAHQNLASIMELDGRRDFARYHRQQAYGRQSMFFDTTDGARLTVLILCTEATGNVPCDWLLPQARYNRIRWIMEYASDEQFETLPDFDLIFNAIGDQDVTQASSVAVARLLLECDKPVLNMPYAVARTARQMMPALFSNLHHVLVPKAVRVVWQDGNALSDSLRELGMTPPLLLRPAAAHGGKGLKRCESFAEVVDFQTDAADVHACAFHDFRSADGYYRKYRMIFIGGKPFAYHLAISSNWLVHYGSADMLAHQWKLDEELRFLKYPAAVLGWSAMQALRQIGSRLDLDFCGIDFSLLPDGRLLVFEANATMLVHLEEFHEPLQFKNPYVQRILDAFHARVETAAHSRSPCEKALMDRVWQWSDSIASISGPIRGPIGNDNMRALQRLGQGLATS